MRRLIGRWLGRRRPPAPSAPKWYWTVDADGLPRYGVRDLDATERRLPERLQRIEPRGWIAAPRDWLTANTRTRRTP